VILICILEVKQITLQIAFTFVNEDFRISNAHLATTLMDKNLHLNVDMKSDLTNSQKYQSVVGSLFCQYVLCNKHDIKIHEGTQPQEPHMVTLNGC
jgi:hypothetical protein